MPKSKKARDVAEAPKKPAKQEPQTSLNMSIAQETGDPLQLELLEKLNQALSAYELKRAAILQKAMDEDGIDAVGRIESEYRALNDAYYEVLRSALAANGGQYVQLMERAKDVTAQIKKKIDNLQDAIDLTNNIAESVNLIGRILILFGI